MNNSMMSIDREEEPVLDRTPWLRQRETELVSIIEAIRRVSQSQDWKKLHELVFDGLEDALMSRLKAEAEKTEISNPEIYRLQGQLTWAKKYADFDKLAEFFATELKGVRNNLK